MTYTNRTRFAAAFASVVCAFITIGISVVPSIITNAQFVL